MTPVSDGYSCYEEFDWTKRRSLNFQDNLQTTNGAGGVRQPQDVHNSGISTRGCLLVVKVARRYGSLSRVLADVELSPTRVNINNIAWMRRPDTDSEPLNFQSHPLTSPLLGRRECSHVRKYALYITLNWSGMSWAPRQRAAW